MDRPLTMGCCGYPGIREVESRTIIGNRYDLSRYNSMFTYSGGTANIHFDRMELALMRRGNIAIAPHNGKLYALYSGAPGGEYDYEYMPRRFIGANPYIDGGWSYDLEIGTDCVLIRNDIEMQGLLPLLTHSNYMRSVNELTMYMAMINSRTQNILDAGNDGDAAAVELWMRDLEAGKLTAITGKNILQRLSVLPYGGKTDELTDLIEMEQYHRATLFNELGLNANYNMKREAVNSSEAQMSADSLMSLVSHMLDQRKRGWHQVNDLFGEYLDLGPVEVELTGTWRQKQEAAELPMEPESETDSKTEGGVEAWHI